MSPAGHRFPSAQLIRERANPPVSAYDPGPPGFVLSCPQESFQPGGKTSARKILITECSSGFGLDATKTLSKKGHHVYANMRATKGRTADEAWTYSSTTPAVGSVAR